MAPPPKKQRRRPEQSREQTKQGSHRKSPDAEILIRPFAFKAHEQSESQCDSCFHGNLDGGECLTCSVECF